MVTAYANKDEWAVQQNKVDFAAYAAASPDGIIESKIVSDLDRAARILNQYCNPENPEVSITSVAFTGWLKVTSISMVNRMHDLDIPRKSQKRSMFNPHNFLYIEERDYCMLRIALGLENLVFGGADSS